MRAGARRRRLFTSQNTQWQSRRGNICYFSKWACGIARRVVYIPAASVIVSQEVRLFTNLAAIPGMWAQEQYRSKLDAGNLSALNLFSGTSGSYKAHNKIEERYQRESDNLPTSSTFFPVENTCVLVLE